MLNIIQQERNGQMIEVIDLVTPPGSPVFINLVTSPGSPGTISFALEEEMPPLDLNSVSPPRETKRVRGANGRFLPKNKF